MTIYNVYATHIHVLKITRIPALQHTHPTKGVGWSFAGGGGREERVLHGLGGQARAGEVDGYISVDCRSGWKWVLASSDTISSQLLDSFLARAFLKLFLARFYYHCLFTIFLCYPFSVFEFGVWGMGHRPSTYSEPFL